MLPSFCKMVVDVPIPPHTRGDGRELNVMVAAESNYAGKLETWAESFVFLGGRRIFVDCDGIEQLEQRERLCI